MPVVRDGLMVTTAANTPLESQANGPAVVGAIAGGLPTVPVPMRTWSRTPARGRAEGI